MPLLGSTFRMDGGDEEPAATHRQPNLFEQGAVQEVEVASQVVPIRLERESWRLDVGDARFDALGDASSARLVHHPRGADS